METKEQDITLEEIPSIRLVLTAVTLLLTSLALTLSFGLLYESSFLELLKYSVYTIVMNFVAGFYLYQNKKNILRKRYSWWLISFCYLITVGSVLIPLIPNFLVNLDILEFPVWILGIALLAMFVDTNLALLLSFGMIMFTYYGNITYEVQLLPLVLSFIICFLARYLTRWISFLYALLVTLSLFITMLVIQSDFTLDKLLTKKNIIYYACVFLILLLSFLSGSIAKVFSSKKKSSTFPQTKDQEEFATSLELVNEGLSKEDNNDLTTLAFEGDFLLQDGNKSCFTVQEVTNLRFPLMRRLEEESPKLYHHSNSIAHLSQRAAGYIGAKEDIAYAGGLYHEVGRLLGPDYVKNGEELASQYKLPKEVSDLIRQHNFKVELPKTKEAAIVMLSDNIFSTILYLKNSGETSITAEKVIENTFSIRMNKGTLDESGISIKDFHKLKEFYISNIDYILNS
ncbi:HD domain-containing protein [Lachnoclostridium phytofermentans]|uniref:Metal dependent phosphohydrolase n=1 Tax=Lachnoclostridium phytofermentans (strain ATCC 700394 / DSM 18823 / ISDg) TaxID=357809 RepID=A9KMW0_LACP7|nr:HD domain-containing protein [Lachnoclostridium phytofermentans]ABX42971.1 metal dependent phosphohydrolase [Lachnoclostridium phytofermentans ISDg]